MRAGFSKRRSGVGFYFNVSKNGLAGITGNFEALKSLRFLVIIESLLCSIAVKYCSPSSQSINEPLLQKV